MNDELEMKIRQRAQEMWEGEGRPDGLAERHWLAAEREGTEETENAAVSRWAAPVKGSHVETGNEAGSPARRRAAGRPGPGRRSGIRSRGRRRARPAGGAASARLRRTLFLLIGGGDA